MFNIGEIKVNSILAIGGVGLSNPLLDEIAFLDIKYS